MRSSLLAGGAVPIVDHLRGKNGVQDKSADEAVQNELVVDFLECGEDARERAEQVVEDLRLTELA